MYATRRPRLTTALALCCLATACTGAPPSARPAARPSAVEGPTLATGTARPTAPQPSAQGLSPVSPEPGASAAPSFAVPAQVNLPLPSYLLGNQARLLLSDSAREALAKGPGAQLSQGLRLGPDGNGIVANHGGGIIANHGGGIVSNNSGALVAHGGGYRLAQNPGDADPNLFFALSAVAGAKAVATTQLLIYAWQARALNQLLTGLGSAKRWVSQKPTPLVLRVNYLGDQPTLVASNAVPTAGPRGPILWLFDVGEPLVAAHDRGTTQAQRTSYPFLALELLGEGKARALWLPVIPGIDLAFATEFNLSSGQSLAELGFRSTAGGQERRVRLAFEALQEGLRVRTQALHRGPEWPQGQSRRVALLAQKEAESARFSAQAAEGTGPFAWLGAEGPLVGSAPRFFELRADGDSTESNEGPRVDELAARLELPGLGAFEGPAPAPLKTPLSQDPSFAWPAPPPAPDQVATDAELMDCIRFFLDRRAAAIAAAGGP